MVVLALLSTLFMTLFLMAISWIHGVKGIETFLNIFSLLLGPVNDLYIFANFFKKPSVLSIKSGAVSSVRDDSLLHRMANMYVVAGKDRAGVSVLLVAREGCFVLWCASAGLLIHGWQMARTMVSACPRSSLNTIAEPLPHKNNGEHTTNL